MPVKNTAASTLAVSVVRPLYYERREDVKSLDVEYPELGMEAVWKIENGKLPGVYPCG
ncbi:hypothetical protein ACLB1O_08950 [Escherichia coli]